MGTLRDLQSALQQKLEDIRRRDEVIYFLEMEVHRKDVIIQHLQNELDKFKTILKPLTKQVTKNFQAMSSEDGDRGVEPCRVKKQAISAEPNSFFSTSVDLGSIRSLTVKKVPKSIE